MENEPPPPPQTPPTISSPVTTSPPLPPPPSGTSPQPNPETLSPEPQQPPLQTPSPPPPPTPLEAPPTRSDGRVIGALSLLLGTLLVLLVLLSGIGWLGWRLYRTEHRTVASPIGSSADNGPGPSPTPAPSVSNAPADHPSSNPTATQNQTADIAAAATASTAPTAPAAQPGGVNNAVAELTGFSPTSAATGDIVTLSGHGLSKTDEVILIPMDASSYFEAATIEHTDTKVTFAVPEMNGTMSLNFALGVFNDNGASLLLNQDVPTTALGGVVPTSKGALRVSPGDAFSGQDHLLVVAEKGARLAVGDNCFVILEDDALLAVCGKHCHVFAKFDRQNLSPAEVRGDTNLPSVNVTLVPHDLEYRGNP